MVYKVEETFVTTLTYYVEANDTVEALEIVENSDRDCAFDEGYNGLKFEATEFDAVTEGRTLEDIENNILTKENN